MCLAQGPQRSDAGEARTLGPESSTLPLSHCAPLESVTCVILALLAMSFTMFWNVVSLTLIGKSFYHISKGNLLTALPMQIYLMILTLGD